MTAATSTTVLTPARGESLPGFDVVDTQAHVVSNVAVNADYFHMILAAGGVASAARAGQFFNVLCPATAHDMPYLRRPMSVYGASPKNRQVEFLYKVTGAGTRGLATLRAGNKVSILGPLGNGFTLSPKYRNIVVLGRGVGLATLAPLAELAASKGIGVTAILSARSKSLVMSVKRFTDTGAAVQIVTDADGTSDPFNVEHLLLTLIEKGKADAFFTCGSDRLMKLMKRVAAHFKLPGQVAMEQQMACGLGMCFCCVRTFEGETGNEQRRVCFEGPVFNLEDALSW